MNLNELQQWLATLPAGAEVKITISIPLSASLPPALIEEPFEVPKKRRSQPPTCTEPGCDRKTLAKGLCTRHYYARKRKEKLSLGDRPAQVEETDPNNMTACRKAKGLTLAAIGLKLGVTKECVRQYEAGILLPHGDKLKQFAEILGKTEDDLRLHFGWQARRRRELHQRARPSASRPSASSEPPVLSHPEEDTQRRLDKGTLSLCCSVVTSTGPEHTDGFHYCSKCEKPCKWKRDGNTRLAGETGDIFEENPDRRCEVPECVSTVFHTRDGKRYCRRHYSRLCNGLNLSDASTDDDHA